MQKWHIGDVTIARIVELEMATSDRIIADATPTAGRIRHAGERFRFAVEEQ